MNNSQTLEDEQTKKLTKFDSFSEKWDKVTSKLIKSGVDLDKIYISVKKG